MSRILIVEDDEANAPRLPIEERARCQIRLHEVQSRQNRPQLLETRPFFAPLNQEAWCRHTIAMEMVCLSLPQDERKDITVVTNSSYGCQPAFLRALRRSNLHFAVMIRPSTKAKFENSGSVGAVAVSEVLGRVTWGKCSLTHPSTGQRRVHHIADLGRTLIQGIEGRLLIARLPHGRDQRAGTQFLFTSHLETETNKVVKAAFWAKWIKPFVRKNAREARASTFTTVTQRQPLPAPEAPGVRAIVAIRPNIAASLQRDEAAWHGVAHDQTPRMYGALAATSPVLNVAELFAGAGGMGLGFLTASRPGVRYRLVFSGEVNPIYARTLQRNHKIMPLAEGCERADWVPQDVQPYDLTQQEALDITARRAAEAGGLHVLIGGPPCQGFSCANRNSGYSGNPHNRLVEVYFEYVERLRPLVFLMENVQGIVWTPKTGEAGAPMVVEDLARRMREMGYLVFPKLLDAVWYGVPQHRSRFFLLGIHQDLGYSGTEFGEWGPFPLPSHGPGTGRNYVTVQDAIQDLPVIENGHGEVEMPYCVANQAGQESFLSLMRTGAPEGVLWDHAASRHAPYVIERYRAIPPGGNWENIQHLMTNYASTDCTHSNIYRRLQMDEPSITIGHYRKSMLIHPQQHRGLSLREAARLQSFPDWFRFAGTTDGDGSERSGLTHKQQQLANAVCPIVLNAVAKHLLQL